MKKLVMLLCGVALCLGGVGSVEATPVSFDLAGAPASSVTLTEAVLGSASLGATLASTLGDQVFTLGDGETRTVDFFSLSTTGTGVGSYSVAANLAFDVPTTIGSAGAGGGYFISLFGQLSAGNLTWDPSTLPDYFTVDGNTIRVDFEGGIAVSVGSPVMVHASITNLGGGTAPVPEPSTMLLLGSGLLGLVAARRKRSNLKG